jgi:hypothetical protein
MLLQKVYKNLIKNISPCEELKKLLGKIVYKMSRFLSKGSELLPRTWHTQGMRTWDFLGPGRQRKISVN